MEFIKKLLENIKAGFMGVSKKKMVENMIVVIGIGAILIIGGSAFFGNSPPKEEKTPPMEKTDSAPAAKVFSQEAKGELEKKLEGILAQIEGAGKVDVMITYASGKEIVPAYDTKKNENNTEEKDTGGGTRSIKQSDSENKLAYEEVQSGTKKPVILKEMEPEVKGVVIVAEGASEPTVRESLSKAVQVLTGVPLHRIQVFVRGK